MAVSATHLDQALVAFRAALVDPALIAGDVESAEHAAALLSQAERLSRLAAVYAVDVVDAVHRSGRYVDHGHMSAAKMSAHTSKCSTATTARSDKIRRMLARCDTLDWVWRGGGMSVDQAAVLGRAFANPRVRDGFIAEQDRFAAWLAKPYRVLERKVADWVRLNDFDGPEPRPEPAHINRDVTLIQDHFSQQWTLRGTFGSLQGAKLRRILDAYTDAERLTDWDNAREVHGATTCRDDLARAASQHRADALEQIFADALHNTNRSAAIDTVHNIVWSEQTHSEMLRRFAGAKPTPVDVDDHGCHSLAGDTLNTATGFADFLISKWRRVVQNAAGVTIDISKTQRFFTGLARLGVQLSFDSCYWPCDIPVTKCQIDHLKPATRGGPTTQSNGAPACQHHNRLKERGYTVARQLDGTIKITTPSGTIIPT